VLFNSYIFIFVFLPIVLLGFHFIGQRGSHRIAISWLIAASLFFYGWWNPAYLGLILVSIIFNFTIGGLLEKNSSKLILALGIIVNLGLLGYFKYANFFVNNINVLTNGNIHLEQIILPLAISFFTFQQITYLVDVYYRLTKNYDFLHYCLFVTFFPQLIAGPIVHHKEMLPQFTRDIFGKLKASHLAVGSSIFILGLFKKVVLADNIAIHATPVFEAAENDVVLTMFEAWGGALAYTFQLYFDFSGYSDMAIGLARMFGVVLPLNFYSPYKANSIIEFWRRWHITLSRFLRDYVYIPLGGNRNGHVHRYKNLMITMLLGGFWHGAGWTFVIWGGMHGLFISINHAWNAFTKRIGARRFGAQLVAKIFGRLITFVAVVIAWVMFRAESLAGAMNMYSGMFFNNGKAIPLPSWLEPMLGDVSGALKMLGFTYHGMFYNGVFGNSNQGVIMLFFMLLIVWFSPNTLDWLKDEKPALGLDKFLVKRERKFLVWKANGLYALIVAAIAAVAIMYIQQESEFLYFQF